MQRSPTHTLLTLAVATAVAGAPILASADDIDIFTGASGGKAANPRVLMVLDNTSNWSRQSQKWPDGASQGQSEATAIRKVIADLDDSVNVGLMEFVTGGSANDNGGYIRQAIGALDDTTKASFTTKLNTIYGNITSPDEKRNSHTPYGNLMYDVYNYFSGGLSYSPSAVISSLGDTDGYTSAFTRFKAPIGSDSICGKTFMIFISNPNSSGPASDDADNTARLNALNGSPVTQLGLANYTTTPTPTTAQVGTTAACYSSASAAAAELPSFSSVCSTYSEGCAIGTETSPAAPIACASGSVSYTVVQSIYTPASSSTVAGTPVVGTQSSSSASSTDYYSSAGAVPSTDHGTLTCPSTSVVTSGGNTATTTYSCSYSVGAAVGTATTTTSTATTTQSGNTGGSGCYKGVGTAAGYWNAASTTDYGGLSCPANSSCTYSGAWASNGSGCTGSGNRKVTVTQTAVAKTKYTITQTVTPTTVNSTTTTTPASTATNVLGKTAQCYASAPGSTSDYASSCTGTNISCTYNNTPTSSTLASCPAGTNAYKVMANDLVLVDTPTGTTYADTGPMNADEWARMMHDKGIPVDGSTIRPSVITYTIDVYNAQPNATHTALMRSMAQAGGGKYFAAKNEQQIIDALKQIMLEIQAVNTAFASTSLPVNATNRSQNENQVFIGMFRPDAHAKPRWFGNLKRYQLVASGANIELGDAVGASAVNTVTGFITPCALSYWTIDSGSYWDFPGLDPIPKGTCNTSSYSSYNAFSDAPDGPLVEKGAAAQMLRQGNNASGDSSNHTLNRKVLTESGGAFTTFSTGSSGLSEDLVNFIRGQDVNDERGLGKTTETRPSIHGDVIHSRPQPVNYGDKGVTVYYGANDGALHAVNASNGTERWAFVAPEFFSRLARMKDNSPLVSYPNMTTTGITPTPSAKDYYFDGSIGLFQNRANSKIMIFPTMRRGGRMIYGIDVTDPDAPKYVWKAGCPNLLNDTGCTTGMTGIGQTWSMPNVAYLKGYSTTVPVMVVGGGYDNCEDADSKSPSCGSAKGGRIYVLNANTGELIREFTTSRGVAADVALVDINHDGYPDYAYAADMGGNLYRVDFVDNPTSLTALASTAWVSRTVAYTSGAGRKFLFAPALLGNQNKVYVAIGTGDREHPLEKQYPYAQVVNRFYVYMDDLTRGLATPAVNLDTLLDYTSNTNCDTPSVYPDSGLTGWFMNLNQYGQGEQVVTSALIASGMVTFSTNRPLPEATGTCSTTLGEAGGYWVNLFNASGAINVEGSCGGTRRSVFVGGGLVPSPVLASSVKVGSKYVSVVIGAVKKGSAGATGANVAFDSQRMRPTIRSNRKRSYSYTVSD